MMRATSLTSFSHQGKRTFYDNLGDPFSKILKMEGAQRYNNNAEDEIFRIKQKFAKQAISIEKQ